MAYTDEKQEQVQLSQPEDLHVSLLRARFHEQITLNLTDAAHVRLLEAGIPEEQIQVHHVPGSFELPQAARSLIRNLDPLDGIITIGTVIRGETPHFDYICQSASMGIQQVAIDADIPVLFGVLTCDTKEQAKVRASDENGMNKGKEAANALIEMLHFEQSVVE